MGLSEDLAAMKAKIGGGSSPAPPDGQPPQVAEPTNPLQDDLAKMRQSMGHGTERRPGERTVSSSEDLANQRAITQAPQTTERFPIGATALGIGAGIVAAPLVGTAAAMSIAIMASGVGELGQSAIETLIDSPTKPKDAPDLLGRVGKEMVVGGIGEGAGRGVIGAGRKANLLFFTPRKVTPEAKDAMQFLRQEGKELPLLPAKATESRGIDLLHNVAEHSFTGGGTMAAFVRDENAFMGNLAENIIQRIGKEMTPEQAGELLVESAKGNLRQSRQPATVLYNSLTEAIAPKKAVKDVPTEVNTGMLDIHGNPATRTVIQKQEVLEGGLRTGFKDIKSFVKEKADIQDRLANIGSEITGGTLLQRFEKIADRPYVSDLIEFRTVLRGMKEGLESGLATRKDPAIGMLKTLESKVSDRINNALMGHNPMLLAVKKEADRIWKEGSKTYNNKVIRQLSQMMDIERTGAPERVVKSVFAPQALTRMQTVKAAVSPEAWDRIARQGMELVMAKSKKDGVVQGQRLLDGLIGKNGLGERGLVEAVGPIEAQRWIKFASAVKFQQSRQAAGEGSMMIQLAQPGALLAVGGGLMGDSDALTATGGIVLALPFIAARVMTNPRAAAALIEGMTTRQTAKASLRAGIMTRLMSAIVPRDVETQPSRTPSAEAPRTLSATELALSGTNQSGKKRSSLPSFSEAR